MSSATSALNVRILPLREEDIPDLVRLARDIWYAHYPSIITVEQIEYMLDQRYRPEVIREQLASRTAWWDKLLLDGAMVAFTSYELGEHTDAMKLDKLYVRYDLRRTRLREPADAPRRRAAPAPVAALACISR